MHAQELIFLDAVAGYVDQEYFRTIIALTLLFAGPFVKRFGVPLYLSDNLPFIVNSIK